MRPPVRADERGFVLIGVVWLLLLATALVAALLLRARAESQRAGNGIKLTQDRLDLDAATETVLADLVMRGGASQWAMLPARGSVPIGDRAVEVRVTSEQGRLDLAKAAPDVIAQALQGLGVAPRQRYAFVQRLEALRSNGPIETIGQTESMIALLGSGADGTCWNDIFTLAAGTGSPDIARASASVQAALAQPSSAGPAPLRAGEAVRVEATGAGGLAERTSLRAIVTADHIGQRSTSVREARCGG